MSRQKKRSRAEWRQILDGLKASPLTQKQYAKQVGCHPSAFGWWRNRFKQLDAAGHPGPRLAPSQAGFVELRAPGPAEAVRVENGDGVVVAFSCLPPPEYILTLLRRQ